MLQDSGSNSDVNFCHQVFPFDPLPTNSFNAGQKYSFTLKTPKRYLFMMHGLEINISTFPLQPFMGRGFK